jgi:hypothetical protein
MLVDTQSSNCTFPLADRHALPGDPTRRIMRCCLENCEKSRDNTKMAQKYKTGRTGFERSKSRFCLFFTEKFTDGYIC